MPLTPVCTPSPFATITIILLKEVPRPFQVFLPTAWCHPVRNQARLRKLMGMAAGLIGGKPAYTMAGSTGGLLQPSAQMVPLDSWEYHAPPTDSFSFCCCSRFSITGALSLCPCKGKSQSTIICRLSSQLRRYGSAKSQTL